MDFEVWRLRTSALRRYKGNCGTRYWPEKFRDFWETGPKTAKFFPPAEPFLVSSNFRRASPLQGGRSHSVFAISPWVPPKSQANWTLRVTLPIIKRGHEHGTTQMPVIERTCTLVGAQSSPSAISCKWSYDIVKHMPCVNHYLTYQCYLYDGITATPISNNVKGRKGGQNEDHCCTFQTKTC